MTELTIDFTGESAKAIFERAGLPNEILGRIWGLSDREGKGSLDMTEFIIAMHLVTSYKARALTALPTVLPPGLYEAAARRGAPAPPGSRAPAVPPTAIPRQFTGSQRAQSPLARAPYGTPPPPMSAQTTGGWLITPQEKAKYDQFFNGIDTSGAGYLNGEQAVKFFSDSGLPEDTLAQIWDLADINSEGRLSRDEFAVAMYLIRQERSKPAGGPSLPAFLPPALIPPSMRNLPRPTAHTTAPTFDNAANTSQFPKSATEDLFGLDDSPPKAAPAPAAPVQTAQTTGGSAAFGSFGGTTSPVPISPPRATFTPQPTGGSTMFKPFMPSSAFGASLAAQNTGGSNASSQPQQRAVIAPSPMDDLLGEAPEEETKNITTDTTELANMSNQIGNLRNQMQDVQTKKETSQRDLTATNSQKRDLEMRLQQFRASYEQEVRTVKALEEQLTTSRNETKRLQQDLAMIEGTHQDLTTQHQTIFQQLTADQQENASLKQRISQLNAEIAQLKPQVEKMRSDARQQKGMVAINKKQLATNEGERGNLQGEMSSLTTEMEEWEKSQKAEHEERERQHQERGLALQDRETKLNEREMQLQQREQEHARSVQEHSRAVEEQSRSVASPQTRSAAVSPTPSTSTNPFFRSAGTPGPMSPGAIVAAAPSSSAFDSVFGPAFPQQHSQAEAAPPTSFRANESGQSVSSEGHPTPSVTPPLSTTHDHDFPPPPPESRQFTPNILPMRNLQREPSFDSSVRGLAPPSIDNRSVATGPVSSPFDGTNALEPSPFGHEDVTTPPGQMSGPAVQSLNAQEEPREVTQLPTPLPESESMPGAFPEDASTPMTAQTTGQSQSVRPVAQKAAVHDDFDSAFAGFGEPAQSKGKEPVTDAFEPVVGGMSRSATGGNDEFPAIRELEHDDTDTDSDNGFDDDFSAGPSAGNGAPLEPVVTEHIEHAAPSVVPDTAVITSAIAEEPVRPAFGEETRALTDLPEITAQSSPPTYESSVEHRSGSNQFPPEFKGLLPSREDPTQVAHSVPTQAPLTPTTANSDVFHDAGSRPISSATDLGPAAAVAAGAATIPAAKSTFDDDFAGFDDLDEAQEATGDESAFGADSEIRENEFNPTFDSPGQSIHTLPAGSASHEQTPVISKMQHSAATNGFSDFDSNAGTSSGPSFGHQQQPSLSSAFGTTPAPQAQAPHDWDAIFSGLDASPNVDSGAAFPTIATPPATSSSSMAAPSGLPFPGIDNSREEPSSSSSLGRPAKPELGRAMTNTGEHDDPTVKRLVGMGFPRDKSVKALEDFDYNIDRVCCP